jgi:preprotein translocase subunit SecE
LLVLVASTIFALVIGAIDWVFKTGLQWFYTVNL